MTGSRFDKGNTAAARLTAEHVFSIRERYANRQSTQRQLAAEFGVTITTISNIVHGLTWQRVPRPESPEDVEHRIAESQRRLQALLQHDAADEAIEKQILDLTAPKLAVQPPRSISENAADLASMAEGLRKRKADLDSQATEETRDDQSHDNSGSQPTE